MKAVVPKSRAATGQLERFFGWVPEAAGALARWLVEISRSGASGKPQCFPAFPLPTDCSHSVAHISYHRRFNSNAGLLCRAVKHNDRSSRASPVLCLLPDRLTCSRPPLSPIVSSNRDPAIAAAGFSRPR